MPRFGMPRRFSGEVAPRVLTFPKNQKSKGLGDLLMGFANLLIILVPSV